MHETEDSGGFRVKVHAIAVDDHELRLLVRKRQAHDPVIGGRRMSCLRPVVRGDTVVLPQLHREYAVHHTARADKEDVIRRILFKKLRVLCIAVLLLRKPCQTAEKACGQAKCGKAAEYSFPCLHLFYPQNWK